MQYREYCNQLKIRLDNLNPRQVLERGYSLSYIDGEIIRDIRQVRRDSEIHTEVKSGSIWSKVSKIKGKKNAQTN
ncbi:MAG TPA: hypothetical protein ENO27_03495 [Caldithrix sp.]|nr:hypothetical protein [Caldithrix sp.]